MKKKSPTHTTRLAALWAAMSLTGVAVAQVTSPMPAPTHPSVPAETGPPLGQPAAQPRGQSMGTAQPGGSGLPPAPQVRQSGSVDYMNGGAGEEARAAMDAQGSQFSLHNVFSGEGGQYVIARKVTIRRAGNASGEPIRIDNAGPILMVSLPPGNYTVEAEVDGKTQRKTVKLAGKPVKLNWNWPGA